MVYGRPKRAYNGSSEEIPQNHEVIMSITDTSKKPRTDWLLGGNPRAIEVQEAVGQQELVNGCELPFRVNGGDRKVLEAAGVVFGEKVDNLFCKATLPAGWTKRATDHSMWSELVDDQGVVRATMFYKAAFYDRDAFLNVKS